MTVDRWRTRADGPRWLYAAPGRLRSIWRLAVFGFGVAMFQPIAESIVVPVFGVISKYAGEVIPAYPWVMLAGITAALVLAARIVDETPWDAVGLGAQAWRLKTVAQGAMLGVAALSGTMMLLWIGGQAHVVRLGDAGAYGIPITATWGGTALRLAVLLAPAALWEELVFRGYLWTVTVDAAGVRVARWSTAVAFGVVHLMNPGSSILTTVTVTVAGYALGVIREHTNSVLAAFSAHFLWNWTMAAVLHVAVSGVAFEMPGYTVELSGPAWWSGGAWGPEGGVAALVILSGAVVISNVTRHGSPLGDFWQRRVRRND